MTALSFARWRPDAAGLNAPHLLDIYNAICADGGYIPFPSFAAFSDAVPSAPLGGITVRDTDGLVHIFVGTENALYKLDNTTLSWTPVSQVSANQATNGTFASDTGWTKGTGWTIAAGVATATTVANGVDIDQAQSLTVGSIYKVVYTVSGFSAGGVRPFFSGGTQVNGDTVTADGTYTAYLTAVTGNNRLGFEAVGTTTLNLDNVTLQEMAPYNATVSERWRFRQYGEFVVAVNINDDPQVYELNVSAEFTDLGGNPPRARQIAVWGNHLALMDDNTVYWSDTDDIAEWTTGNAGSQPFPDSGILMGATDMTNPLIFQKSAIHRGSFMPGSTEVFTFTKIHDKRGASSPYGICSRGDFTFFPDAGAFYQITNDGTILPIGAEKIDRLIFGAIGGVGLANIYGEVDPFFTRVYFAVQISSTSDAYDRMLIYDWQIQEWTQIEINVGILFPLASGTIGYTLEGLDAISATLEGLPFSLDSKVWQGGAPVMGALDENFMLGFFSGAAAQATLTVQEVGEPTGELSYISNIYPIVDTDELTVAVGTRNRRQDDFVFGPEIAPNTITGAVNTRSKARFHSFRVTIAEGADWTKAQGLDVASTSAGWR